MRHRPLTARAHGPPRRPGAIAARDSCLAGVSSTKPSAKDRSVRTDAASGQRVSDGGGQELYTDNPKLRGDGKPASREVSEQSREWERETKRAEGKPAGFKAERNGSKQMLTVVLGCPWAEGNRGLQSVLEEARGALA